MVKEWYLNPSSNYFSGYENDEFSQNSGTVFNELLANSPETYTVTINGVSKQAIIQSVDNKDERILLANIGDVSIGDLIGHINMNWLVIELPVDNKIHSSTLIKLCNETLILSGTPTKVLKGNHPFTNEPVYDYVAGMPISYPCIVTKRMDNDELQNQYISINNDSIIVTLPYFDFKEEQIELYNEKYQVKSVDKTKSINGVGLLTILGEKV